MSRLSAAIRSLARASAHPESLLTPATPAVSSLAVRRAKAGQRRYASGPGNRIAKQRYNFNTSLNYTGEPDENHISYRRVTALELAHRSEPPTKVKMLVRDFIHDSLYNPHYGYFSKNVTIFTPPEEGYDFGSFRDTAHFQETVAERYEREYGNMELSADEAGKAGKGSTGGLGRQVWHTPTELFKPYYAQSLINAILSNYNLYHYPSQDLLLYEVGAGNGSFMVDSLRYLRDEHPDVFARTRYRIIEISPALAQIQKRRAEKEGFGDRVEVINEDVFKWGHEGEVMDEPCYVVALEVFDNFSHDMIRYDLTTLEPLQAVVSIDETGDFSLLYEPITDPHLQRILSYRRYLPSTSSTSPPLPKPLLASPTLRKLYTSLPFIPNLSPPDFVPTQAVRFLERLREKLPAHRLMMADFDSLPDAVEGRNGPVVQTRYGGSMVPCETFLVKQGYFDIFFPTDFELLRDTYTHIMTSPTPNRPIPVPSSAAPPSPTPSAAASAKGKKPKSHPAHTAQPSTPPAPADAEGVASAATSASASSASTSAPTLAPLPLPLKGDFFSSSGVRGFRRRKVEILTQADFIEKHASAEMLRRTRVGDGGSVMLGMYRNAKVMF